MSQTLILGGPGCGKTTALLEIIEQKLSDGIEPHRIGYVTFTRKAAQEGRDRAAAKFGFSRDDLPYFRTLHSLAFKQLSIGHAQLLTDAHMRQFASWAGVMLSQRRAENEDDVGMGISISTPDDTALAALSLSRLMVRPLRDITEMLNVDLGHARRIARDYDEFKDARGLLDFTDMLEQYRYDGIVPELDVLIVDEAQDLSHLQWMVVERLKAHVPETFIAGDDDQAIYEWAGADVPYFLALEGAKRVLPVSYRLRRRIFDLCQRIVEPIDARYEKDWKPHAKGGEIARIDAVSECNLGEESWYILARNNFLLKDEIEYLRLNGFPYFKGAESSIDNDEVRALLTWEHLRKGGRAKAGDVEMIYGLMKTGMVAHGHKSRTFDLGDYSLDELRQSFGLLTDQDWLHVLDIKENDKAYYREIKRRGNSLTDAPKITVSTIHGVKGGEADNVVLFTDLSKATYDHLNSSPSAEHRVFFVGASRARHRLFIRNPKSMRFFPL